MTMQVITLTAQDQKRVTLHREWKARKHLDTGKHVAWLCEDKLRQVLVLSGKLSLCATFINSLAEDNGDRVSVPGLYTNIRNTSARTSGWHKHRWKVHPVPLTEVTHVFSRMSAEHARAAVIASPGVVEFL